MVRRTWAVVLALVLAITSMAGVSAQGSDPTRQELDYFDALQDELDTTIGASEELSALFGEAGRDPTVIFDDTWKLEMVVQLVTLQMLEENAATMSPSPRQQHIHDLWLEITALTTRYVDDVIVGLDNIDPGRLEQGTNRIVYASLLVQDLTRAIELFGENPNAAFTPEYPAGAVQGCEPFADFETAQQYYAAYPEMQQVIDPNWDGRACEVHFGIG